MFDWLPNATYCWYVVISLLYFFFKGDENRVVIYIVSSRVTWPFFEMVDRITGCTWWPVFPFPPFYISYFACDSD